MNLEATPDKSSEIRCSEEFKEHRSLRRGEKILKICADNGLGNVLGMKGCHSINGNENYQSPEGLIQRYPECSK